MKPSDCYKTVEEFLERIEWEYIEGYSYNTHQPFVRSQEISDCFKTLRHEEILNLLGEPTRIIKDSSVFLYCFNVPRAECESFWDGETSPRQMDYVKVEFDDQGRCTNIRQVIAMTSH